MAAEGWRDRLEVCMSTRVFSHFRTFALETDTIGFAVIKIVGAAASAGSSFDDLMNLGNYLGKSMVSIASTMDHCHVPGRTEHAMLANDEIELGTGPHNEPVPLGSTSSEIQ